MMKHAILFQFSVVLAVSITAQANFKFSDLMKSLTQQKANIVLELPDTDLFLKAGTLDQAASISRKQNFADILSQATAGLPINSTTIQNLIAKKQTTIVIVPGLFGEFIETRAFEEVFARPSSYKSAWMQIVAVNAAQDSRFDLEKNQVEPAPLSQLLDAASIDDASGKPLLKLVILKTKLGSLESIGNNAAKAAVFNRRLQKYFELSHDENIVMLGYSRGTPLALEMVTQAQSANLSYLSRVQAVVSYAGVVMGSSLADLTDDPTSESGKQFAAVKELLASLQTSTSRLDQGYRALQNTAALSKFGATLALGQPFDVNGFLKTSMSGDFNTAAMLVLKVTAELGLKSINDFNGHVERARLFINEILTSVEGLKTKSAVVWWKSHSLPKHIKYMSISAAMVDPLKSTIEKEVYDTKIGYNETLDDDRLQANRRTYEKATGFGLNDSQVALHQSIFMPRVIENLNPQNAGLQIEHLGLLQTHHWGVSLRVVNVMKDGRVNPYPREKALLALVAYLNQ